MMQTGHNPMDSIVAFLEENNGRWFTFAELGKERHLSRSSQELNENLQTLVKDGKIRVKFDGREYCYRALSDRLEQRRAFL